jgi:hypothetical protein
VQLLPFSQPALCQRCTAAAAPRTSTNWLAGSMHTDTEEVPCFVLAAQSPPDSEDVRCQFSSRYSMSFACVLGERRRPYGRGRYDPLLLCLYAARSALQLTLERIAILHFVREQLRPLLRFDSTSTEMWW